MDCDKALLEKPPRDIVRQFNYSITPPSKNESGWMAEKQVPANSVEVKREAFMICGLTHAVNEALRYHKRHSCGVIRD
jgi:hypothetical protein